MKKREEILADLYGDAFRAALEAGPAIHQGNLDTVLDMADRMVALAREQEGFIDVESASRTSDGFGITVSYWRDLESIRKWKNVSEHAAAQRMGRDAFYRSYRLRVARIEREYGFDRDE